MAYGMKSVAIGVGSGVAGVVKQPYKGAKQEGVKGFFKGTAKGLGGVVAKPISGGLDFVQKTTEGASNMVKIGGKKRKKLNKDTFQSSMRLTESIADRNALGYSVLQSENDLNSELNHSESIISSSSQFSAINQ